MGFNLSRLRDLFRPQKKNLTLQNIQISFPADNFTRLEKILGTTIGNKNIYVEAFIHRSFLEENEKFEFSNERLEYLGDSVLNLVIGEFLFNKFPKEEEGFLTKVRAKMVNRNALSSVAENINIGDFMILSSNIPKTVTQNSKSILSDALEALIGALYLDKGIDTCRSFIQKNIVEPMLKEGEHLVDENYKSQLLEFAQANKLANPVYQITSEEGPHHDKTFSVEVVIGAKVYGKGKGKSKKEAEQYAAKTALKKLQQ
ncbi:MAG: ribonuclease III [Ignavibacteriaceae bacterium]